MRSIFKNRCQKGFTLIEVLVTSLVMSIVLAGVGSVLIVSARLNNESVAEAFLQTNLQGVLKSLAADVRNGQLINISPNGKWFIVEDDNGNQIKWSYDVRNKQLKRNNHTVGMYGADKAEFICEFSQNSDRNVTIKLKLDITKGTNCLASTGNELVVYRFNCRNTVNY